MNVPTKKFLSLFVFALFCKITFSESLPDAVPAGAANWSARQHDHSSTRAQLLSLQ